MEKFSKNEFCLLKEDREISKEDGEKKYQKVKDLESHRLYKLYLAKDVILGTNCLLSQYEETRNHKLEEYRQYRDTLSEIDSPFFVRYIESYVNSEGGLNIIQEYTEGKTLQEVINEHLKKKEKIKEAEIKRIFLKLAKGIQYIHHRNIVHRELKPSKVLLINDEVKIVCTYAVKKLRGNTDRDNITYGSMHDFCPEVLDERPYGLKVDVWYLGMILYEMMTLKMPFYDENLTMLYQKVLAGFYDPIEENYSKELKNVVDAIFKIEPLERPSINELLKIIEPIC